VRSARYKALHHITEPTIALNHTEGYPGTEVTVQGSGWMAEDPVKIYFGHDLGYEIGAVYSGNVNDAGRFETTITVPDAVGEYVDEKLRHTLLSLGTYLFGRCATINEARDLAELL